MWGLVLKVLANEGPLGMHFLKTGSLHYGHLGLRYFEQLPCVCFGGVAGVPICRRSTQELNCWPALREGAHFISSKNLKMLRTRVEFGANGAQTGMVHVTA